MQTGVGVGEIETTHNMHNKFKAKHTCIQTHTHTPTHTQRDADSPAAAAAAVSRSERLS